MRVKVVIELEIEDLCIDSDLEEFLEFEFNGSSNISLENEYVEKEINYDVKSFSYERN